MVWLGPFAADQLYSVTPVTGGQLKTTLRPITLPLTMDGSVGAAEVGGTAAAGLVIAGEVVVFPDLGLPAPPDSASAMPIARRHTTIPEVSSAGLLPRLVGSAIGTSCTRPLVRGRSSVGLLAAGSWAELPRFGGVFAGSLGVEAVNDGVDAGCRDGEDAGGGGV